jgi:hypothetical protein
MLIAAVCRQELQTSKEQEEHAVWCTVIRRLELLSMVFYLFWIGASLYLFFYFDWYMAAPPVKQ